jgi:hypothetical protein
MMAIKLSYETPRKKAARVVLERFDTPDRVTLVVHPEAWWLLPLAAVLVLGAIFFAALFGLEVLPQNDPRFNWDAMAVCASVGCILLLVKAWGVSRSRVVFEVWADRMYVIRVGPFSRPQQVWARSTLDDVVVRRSRPPDNEPPETCRLRVFSTYKGRKCRHDFLEGRRLELLRELANALRAELGWAAQDRETEVVDDRN